MRFVVAIGSKVYVKHNAGDRMPVFCKDCKHFKPNDRYHGDLKFGFCTKSVSINLVDGSVLYETADVVRTNDCHSEWFVPIETKPE